MEIKYAIVSSDENPLYYDFWTIVRDLWSNHIGIKPVFLFITNKDEVIDHGEYIVHKVKSIEGVDTGLQSQIIRMYSTKFYPNDVCITSDIDMLPLGKSYFKSICGDYNDDTLKILDDMGIRIGFRSSLSETTIKGKFEIPRDDHANIYKAMQL